MCFARRGSRGDARPRKRSHHRSRRRHHLPAGVRVVRLWNDHHAHGDAHDSGVSLVEVPSALRRDERVSPERARRRPGDAPPIFTLELTGSGRASARFIGLFVDEVGQTFSLGSLMRYEFVQPQPVPEPGTLFLVGGAIAALPPGDHWVAGRTRNSQKIVGSAPSAWSIMFSIMKIRLTATAVLTLLVAWPLASQAPVTHRFTPDASTTRSRSRTRRH